MPPPQYKFHLAAPDQSAHRVPTAAITTRCGRVWRSLRAIGKPPVHLAGGFEQATCGSCLRSYAAEVLGPQPHAWNRPTLDEPIADDPGMLPTPQYEQVLAEINEAYKRLKGVRGNSLEHLHAVVLHRLAHGPAFVATEIEVIRLLWANI